MGSEQVLVLVRKGGKERKRECDDLYTLHETGTGTGTSTGTRMATTEHNGFLSLYRVYSA